MVNTVRMTCPVDLLAGVPLLLGFVPEESVVVVSLRGDSGTGAALGVTVRVDLPRQQDAAEVAAEVLGHVQRDGASEAVVVVYSEDPDPGARPEISASVAVLRAVGAEQGVPVSAVWHVGPGRYRRLHGRGPGASEGPVDELRNSGAAAELMLTGRTAAASRADLGAGLDGQDTGRVVAVAAAVARAMDVPAAQRGDRAFLVWTMETARAQEAGPRAEIGVEPAGLLLAGLSTPAVRDAFLVSCVPGQHDAAEAMVGGDLHAGGDVLTRYVFGAEEAVHPDREVTCAAMAVLRSVIRQAPPEVQVEPLALLAFLAWWCGEWPLAAECGRRALAADRGHRLTALVMASMDSMVQPGWIAARRDAHLARSSA